MGSPSGEWVGAVSVSWYTDQCLLLSVDQVMPSQLDLGVDLVQKPMRIPSHQH